MINERETAATLRMSEGRRVERAVQWRREQVIRPVCLQHRLCDDGPGFVEVAGTLVAFQYSVCVCICLCACVCVRHKNTSHHDLAHFPHTHKHSSFKQGSGCVAAEVCVCVYVCLPSCHTWIPEYPSFSCCTYSLWFT